MAKPKSENIFITYKLELTTLLIFLVLGVTAAFTQQHPSLTQTVKENVITKGSLEERDQSFVFFYTKKFIERPKAELIIPFSYETEQAPILFVGFTPNQENTQVAHLISHPQLDDLNWSSIQTEDLTLYQKSSNYNSIDEFLKNPPEISKTIVDDLLLQDHPQLEGASNTESTFPLEEFDYILTTYKKPEIQDNIYYAKTIFKIDNAELNENQEIQWFVRAPQADQENKYLLGNINVNYIE